MAENEPARPAGSGGAILTRRREILAGCAASALAGVTAVAGAAAIAVMVMPAGANVLAQEADVLAFESLYKSFGILGFQFSDKVHALRGKPVRMVGFMAPPLKAESGFFVLTGQPLSICPFCQSDADWPVDIVVVIMQAVTPMVSAGRRLMVSGRLEIGSATDPLTGFVSQIRITDAVYRAL